MLQRKKKKRVQKKREQTKLVKCYSKHGYYYPLVAVDVENNPKTGKFICGAVYGERKRWYKKADLELVDQYFTSQTELQEYLKTIPSWACKLVFFNLEYDYKFLYPIMDTSMTIRSGTKLISCEIKETETKCLDLRNHATQGRLEDWIIWLKMDESHGIKKEGLDKIEKRVRSDAKATFVLGSFIEAFYYKECGIPMRLTAASNALLLFRTKYFTDKWERPIDIRQELEFLSYIGGRTELFKPGTHNYHNYDINSCYLSVMRDNLYPDMWTSSYIENGDIWEKYWNYGYQMIMDCDVEVPDCYLPVLPFVSSELDGRLIFPIGTFRGVFTSVELAYGIEIGLVKILRCHQFVYYKRSKPYFRDYANDIWDKRAVYKAEGNKGMDLMMKLLGNSLYGKFAQHKAESALCKLDEFDGDITGLRVDIDINNECWVKPKDEENIPTHCFPGISSFITSNARIKLHKAMLDNKDSLIYVDTDCLKTNDIAKGIEVGKGLGEWGYEGITTGCFYRSKWYTDETNPEKGAKKGIKKNAVLIESTDEYEIWEFERPDTMGESIKKKDEPGKWRMHPKKLTKGDTKRQILDDGDTKPLKLENGLLIG